MLYRYSRNDCSSCAPNFIYIETTDCPTLEGNYNKDARDLKLTVK